MVSEHNVELAYWLGVLHSDGYFHKIYDKKRKLVRNSIGLGVGSKSIPMLKEFMRISKKQFNRKGALYKSVSKEGFTNYQYRFRCSSLMENFKENDIYKKEIPEPPIWVISEKTHLGAYLAGLIDGDGNVSISRPKYPQCKIRIFSRFKPNLLIELISVLLECKVWCSYSVNEKSFRERTFISRCHDVEFKISRKNYLSISKYILPYLKLNYKKEKIEKFIASKNFKKRSAPGI